MTDIYHPVQQKQKTEYNFIQNQPNPFDRFCIGLGRTLEQISATHNSRTTQRNEASRLKRHGRKAIGAGALAITIIGLGLTYAIQRGIENGHFIRSEPTLREQASIYFPDTKEIREEFFQAYRQ